eukprot:gene6990-7733_t
MSSDWKTFFARQMSNAQGSEEERSCANLLFNENDILMGDQRLNNLAAMTYNARSCQAIFNLVEKAISPEENHWKTIYKALLLLHTLLLYGSELAVDKAINLCKFVYPLRSYNSALVVKKRLLFSGGGTDYGAPVRATATLLTDILMQDNNIRQARLEARGGTHELLIPVGNKPLVVDENNPAGGQTISFGQGLTTSVGAGYSLQAVPGMYEGRPDRYFDNPNDQRGRVTQGNSQRTRDALAPSLLDLAFDTPSPSSSTTSTTLPPADYLPALQRQAELEKQLAEQQEILKKLQQQVLGGGGGGGGGGGPAVAMGGNNNSAMGGVGNNTPPPGAYPPAMDLLGLQGPTHHVPSSSSGTSSSVSLLMDPTALYPPGPSFPASATAGPTFAPAPASMPPMTAGYHPSQQQQQQQFYGGQAQSYPLQGGYPGQTAYPAGPLGMGGYHVPGAMAGNSMYPPSSAPAQYMSTMGGGPSMMMGMPPAAPVPMMAYGSMGMPQVNGMNANHSLSVTPGLPPPPPPMAPVEMPSLPPPPPPAPPSFF